MGKVVGAISLSLLLASAGAGWSQEIGIVSAKPNVDTNELIVDIPARPDGEKVYIVRSGTLVTDATIKKSGGQGGTVISLPNGAAAAVQVGDRVSLSPSLAKQLPASAYDLKAKNNSLPPGPAAPTEIGAPVPPPPPPGLPQLEKTETKTVVTETHIQPVMAESTPRGMGVPLFPAPAVTEAGITAPYGQGLAAAAPVGTPYLRSPAFAGPPVIYMPQTVTRVLLPGATPYPSNIMSPPAQYVYSSAPFIRTDIYTSLPYGTFYWPQGYAGTTPVEPQVPAYVTAPASAIMSTEADYTAGRYAPADAAPETMNPISSGINANLVASTALSAEPGAETASVVTAPALTVVQPGMQTEMAPPAVVNPFPVLSDTNPAPSVPTPAALIPTPVIPTPAASPLSALPTLPAAADTAVAGLPNLPAAADSTAAGLPNLPAAVATPAPAATTPASMMPSLPTPATPPAPANVIVVDNKTPGGVTLTPADAWTASASTTESYEGGSVMATVDPNQTKTATFNASIPADGQYEVALWWVGGVPQFRSASVPVTVNTATGPVQATADQTQTGQWHVIGTYQLKAGQNVPVVTLSTSGIAAQGNTVSVSADALRLTPQ